MTALFTFGLSFFEIAGLKLSYDAIEMDAIQQLKLRHHPAAH
jgi:hypothetical protein